MITFVAYSFTFRYFLEQFLKVFMVICIETLYVSGIKKRESEEGEEKRRNLSYEI